MFMRFSTLGRATRAYSLPASVVPVFLGTILAARADQIRMRYPRQNYARQRDSAAGRTAYGLVEGNVGTAYRHRAQILPLLVIRWSP